MSQIEGAKPVQVPLALSVSMPSTLTLLMESANVPFTANR